MQQKKLRRKSKRPIFKWCKLNLDQDGDNDIFANGSKGDITNQNFQEITSLHG